MPSGRFVCKMSCSVGSVPIRAIKNVFIHKRVLQCLKGAFHRSATLNFLSTSISLRTLASRCCEFWCVTRQIVLCWRRMLRRNKRTRYRSSECWISVLIQSVSSYLSREGSVATCVPLFVCSELGWKMSLDPEQTPLMFSDKEMDPGVSVFYTVRSSIFQHFR